MIKKESRTVNILVFESRNYAEQSEAKNSLKICEEKHAFYINEYSQKYFPCVSKTFPVL